jgi:hypothetical protein
VKVIAKFIDSEESITRESNGLWSDGLEALVCLLKGFYKLKCKWQKKSGQSLQNGLG